MEIAETGPQAEKGGRNPALRASPGLLATASPAGGASEGSQGAAPPRRAPGPRSAEPRGHPEWGGTRATSRGVSERLGGVPACAEVSGTQGQGHSGCDPGLDPGAGNGEPRADAEKMWIRGFE